MNIGIDLDEVLVNHIEAFLAYHNHAYGTKLEKRDIFSYSFEQVLGESKQDTRQKLLHFFNTNFFRDMKVIAGAKEAIAVLAREHQLSIITARPEFLLQQTKKLVADHFSHCFSTVTFTNQNQWQETDKRISKSEVCFEREISIMVDDSLHHAKDCASRGIYVLLMDLDYPWNQTSERLPQNIKRVHSWEEIVSEIARYGKIYGK